jgi:hypothetical protein
MPRFDRDPALAILLTGLFAILLSGLFAAVAIGIGIIAGAGVCLAGFAAFYLWATGRLVRSGPARATLASRKQ